MTLSFFVPGLPAPGGSKKAFAHARTGKIVVLDDAKCNKSWRATVALHAAVFMAGNRPLDGPLSVTMEFTLPRPRSHFGTGRNTHRIKARSPMWHMIRPDRTKLLRAAEDACTGILWCDDAQIVTGNVEKRYGDRPGVLITVTELEKK